MKKYFAKYLPIEEEMKEYRGYFKTKFVKNITPVSEKEYYENGGDEINPVGKIDNDKIYVKNQGAYYYKEECVPINFAVCSRNIEVGDIVREGDSEPFEWTMMMDSCLPSDNVYKVIGRISTEATWVKEGMEFDKEDLFANGCGHNWCDETPDLGNYYFKIKGPCGHFH